MFHWTYEHTHNQIDRKPVKFVVSISSGVPSAVAGDVMLNRFGKNKVEMLFADTLVEDEDNYRFLRDLKDYWQVPITQLAEGRTPLQVSNDAKIIPNHRIAPCTFKLKIKPIRDYVMSLLDDYNVVMVIGMDFKDKRKGRLEAPIRNYKSIGVSVFYPLLTYGVYDAQEYLKTEMNLEAPRMYRLGYTHANCGGACVKQGNRDWKRTLTHKPELFAEYEAWEQDMHNESDHFKKHGFLRATVDGKTVGKTLAELRAEVEQADERQLRLFDMIDDIENECATECGVNVDWQDFALQV